MTVDEFLVWSEDQPGRYELIDGVPIRMQAESSRHAVVKLSVVQSLGEAIAKASLRCTAFTDGMTVRIDDDFSYEPDAVVSCSDGTGPDSVEVADPVIVVEVLSPGSANTDRTAKLAGYAKVASIRHYLVVDPSRKLVVHHKLSHSDVIETRILHGGDLELDPPGITVSVASFFEPRPGFGLR